VIQRYAASVGANSGKPVSNLIYKLVRSFELVDDVDVHVLDVDAGQTVVEIVAEVEHSSDVPITRAALFGHLGNLMLDKPARFNLLVRETGLSGDARETVWRLGKVLTRADGVIEFESARGGQG
jgi:hypothetical protein